MTANTSLTLAPAPTKEKSFSIRVMSQGKAKQIQPDQIIHTEASAPMMTARALKCYASHLHDFGFVRVNKADLVNAHKIVRVEDNSKVVMPDNYVSTIARRRKTMLRSLIVGISPL